MQSTTVVKRNVQARSGKTAPARGTIVRGVKIIKTLGNIKHQTGLGTPPDSEQTGQTVIS